MLYASVVCLLALTASEQDQFLPGSGLPAASNHMAGDLPPDSPYPADPSFDPSSFGQLKASQPYVEQSSFGFGNSTPWDEPLVELPAWQLTATCLPSFDDAGFGIFTFDAHHTWLMGYDEIPPVNITPGGAIHFWSGPTALDLPARVYDAYVDFSWRPVEWDRGGLSISLSPGFYGDFERLDSRTFQWTGWFLADHDIGDAWTIMGGVAYYRQLFANWLPVGGAVWTPDADTRFEFLFPQPKVARRCYADGTRVDWIYVAGQFGGGAWSVADTPDTNVLVNYSDLRLLLGWESGTVFGQELRVEFGYVFSRDLGVNNTSLYTPSDTIVAQAMVAF